MKIYYFGKFNVLRDLLGVITNRHRAYSLQTYSTTIQKATLQGRPKCIIINSVIESFKNTRTYYKAFSKYYG